MAMSPDPHAPVIFSTSDMIACCVECFECFEDDGVPNGSSGKVAAWGGSSLFMKYVFRQNTDFFKDINFFLKSMIRLFDPFT